MSQQKNEPQQPNLIIESDEKTKKKLQDFASTYEELSKIKANLDALIDTFTNNPSFLSSASMYWGELVLWQKVLAGILLTVPLIAGVVLNIGVLIAISAVTLGFFILIAISLENHHETNNTNTQRIKDGVSSLANLLSVVINSLAQLSDELKESIEDMQLENIRFTKNIDVLEEQVNLLTANVTQLKSIEQKINNENNSLENIISTLKNSVDDHAISLNETQQQLTKTIQENQTQQIFLSEKIEELNAVKTKLTEKIVHMEHITQVLQIAVEDLSSYMVADNKKRLIYIEKLEYFITNHESSFLAIVERICDAESKLSAVSEELKQCNERHDKLLTLQEKFITKLEKMVGMSSAEIELEFNVSNNRHSFYSSSQSQSLDPQLNHDEQMRLEVAYS